MGKNPDLIWTKFYIGFANFEKGFGRGKFSVFRQRSFFHLCVIFERKNI